MVVLHQLLEHPVEIEVSQRPVQVVGATDRATGFHPRIATHRLTGHRAHHGLVALLQGVVEHLGQLFRGHPSPGTTLTLVARSVTRRLRIFLVVFVERRVEHVPGNFVLFAPEREVHIEDDLEGLPVGMVFHQRGRKCVLERRAILERDVLDRLHRIEILGEAHWESCVSKLDDEPAQQIEQRGWLTARVVELWRWWSRGHVTRRWSRCPRSRSYP